MRERLRRVEPITLTIAVVLAVLSATVLYLSVTAAPVPDVMADGAVGPNPLAGLGYCCVAPALGVVAAWLGWAGVTLPVSGGEDEPRGPRQF